MGRRRSPRPTDEFTSADWIGVTIVAGISAPAMMGAVMGVVLGIGDGVSVSATMAFMLVFLVVGGIPSILVALIGAGILACLSNTLQEDMVLFGCFLGGVLGTLVLLSFMPGIESANLLTSVAFGFPLGAVSARIGLLAGQYPVAGDPRRRP
ncbi:MAG: hypothetical protein AAFR79_03480 [Pseudomonadota bacterium]